MIIHSSIEPLYFLLPVIGFIVGLFGTMLGGGGGFFFFPVLTLLIGTTPQTAVITSLVATIPICLIGSIGHYTQKNIQGRSAILFSAAGIPGAFAGTAITAAISENMLKDLFGIYSCILGLNLAFSTWKKNRKKADQQAVQRLHKIRGIIFGFLGGTITGTFGTSGTAPVLAGLFSMDIPLKQVIGTSLVIILVNTIFATGAHFLLGRIDLTLVLFLTGGSAIGAALGPRLLSGTKTDHSENKIKYSYALVMVIIGLIMMNK